MTLAQVVEVVEAVQAIEEAKQHIPLVYRDVVTFFGKHDVWMYHAILDYKLCDQCLSFAQQLHYPGDHLRRSFPYLEIVGTDKILANVHPNCRCYLTRISRGD